MTRDKQTEAAPEKPLLTRTMLAELVSSNVVTS